MPVVRMMCLANSRKRQGHCVAGLRLDGSGWVRPVSRREYGTLLDEHVMLDNQRPVAPLDIVDLELEAPHPHSHHPEDWLVGNRRWRYVRTATAADQAFLDVHLAQTDSLLHNFIDRIPFGEPVTHSLALVRAYAPRWRIELWESRRRQRIAFLYNGQRYKLGIADPVMERQLGTLTAGDYPLETLDGFRAQQEVLITVSLSEPFAFKPEDPLCCYKLAAAVLPAPIGENLAPIPQATFSRPECVLGVVSKPQMTNSKAEAFQLFDQGCSVELVAKRIGRALSTTSDYLCDYLRQSRRPDPYPWVDRPTFERIAEVARRMGAERLKPIHEALNGEVGYDQIRASIACLRHWD